VVADEQTVDSRERELAFASGLSAVAALARRVLERIV